MTAERRPAAKGRVPPHSVEAEEALLGSMLLSRDAIDVAATTLLAHDFYKPAHGDLFDAICDLRERGALAEPISVSEELRRAGRLERAGGTPAILRIQAAAPASANASHYTRIVAELASMRRLIGAAGDIAEMGYSWDSGEVGSFITRAHELIETADMPLGGPRDLNVVEFIEQRHEHVWALPGMLEVGERLLLVAPEKYGKSTLQRQIAVCASQGVDPFRFTPIPRVNVLLIDLENPDTLVRRKVRPLLDNLAHRLDQQLEPDRLLINTRPEGLDVKQRADELWLQERVAANRAHWASLGWESDPMIVCVGPIYKMLDDELAYSEVRGLQRALDRIRKRFSCALIMETHAPHESFGKQSGPHSLRPAGPRAWMRWCEFCRAIEPSQLEEDTADFYDCQGARDERDWPYRLRRGGRWPWSDDNAPF